MNASYRLNTCKSRGSMGAAMRPMATGARVSNACPTCPAPGSSPPKGGLIPGAPPCPPGLGGKGFVPVPDGGAFH